MSSEPLLIEQSTGGLCTLTLNRPDSLNALSEPLLTALSRAIASDAHSPSVRAVVIRGSGKAFAAGADIKFMSGASEAELSGFADLGGRVMKQIEALAKPVVAAVDGFAIGGGMELALACDIIVASSRAKFGQAEVNLGLIPGFGGTQRLVRRVGVGAAKKLILTGETISAEEAYRIGAVEILTSPESFEDELKKLTQTLLSRAPLAIAAAKLLIDAHDGTTKAQGLTLEEEHFVKVWGTADAKEGLSAFVGKRAAKFEGK